MKSLLHLVSRPSAYPTCVDKTCRTFAIGFYTSMFGIFLAGIFFKPSTVSAQITPPHQIHDWLFLGPDVSSLDIEEIVRDIPPKAQDLVVQSGRDTLSWQPFTSTNGVINFFKQYELYGEGIAFTTIVSDKPQRKPFRFGSNGPFSIWVNGRLIGEQATPRLYLPNEDLFYVDLKQGENSVFVKVKSWQSNWVFSLSNPLLPHHGIHGAIRGTTGQKIPNATILLICDNKIVKETSSNTSGYYSMDVPESLENCNINAFAGEEGVRINKINKPAEKFFKLDLRLQPAAKITGDAFMLDGKTPHAGIFIEAVNVDTEIVVATTLSSEFGQFELVNLPAGDYFLRSSMPWGYYYYSEMVTGTSQKIRVHVSRQQIAAGLTFKTPAFKKGIWKTWTPLDGLPHYHINDITFSDDGQLLCATNGGGMCTFDGNTFSKINVRNGLKSNIIQSLLETDDGSVWLASNEGLARYSQNQIEHFEVPNGLPDLEVNTLLEDSQKRIWIGTKNGLGLLESGNTIAALEAARNLPSTDILSVLEDRQGNYWIGTSLGAGYYDGDTIQNVDLALGYAVNDLHQSVDGAIWMATNAGIFRQHSAGNQHFTSNNGLINNQVLDICESADGLLWFATEGGLTSYNGRHFTNYTTEDGLAFNSVSTLNCSFSKTIWAGTKNGLSRLDYSVKHYGFGDGLVKVKDTDEFSGIFSIKRTKNNDLLIGTEWGGVFKFDDQHIERLFPFDHELYVRNLEKNDDGSFLLATHQGLVEYVPNQSANASINYLKNEDWTAISKTNDEGLIWTGRGWAGGGLSLYDPSSKQTIKHFDIHNGLPDNQVWALETDADGSLWIGTNRGIAKYTAGSIKNITSLFDLESAPIYAILNQKDGTTWFAGAAGVFHLSNNEWTHFTSQGIFKRVDGNWVLDSESLQLPDDIVWALHESQNNTVWFGTQSRGLVGFDGSAYTIIDSRNGLLGNHVMSIDSDHTGKLWIGTLDGGLTVYEKQSHNHVVNLVSVYSGKQRHTFQADLQAELPAFNVGNSISISFQEQDFRTHPRHRQFLVAIRDNAGNEISKITTKNRVFNWVPEDAGNYTFEVQSIDKDLNYSPKAQFSLVIELPVTKNPLFLIPFIIGLLGLIVFSFRLNQKYSNQKKEARVFEKKMLANEQEARKNLEIKNEELSLAYEQAEIAKQDAEKATLAKSLFLSNMSHELRTPMNGVIGMTSLLKDTALNEEQKDFVETIRSSGNALLAVINDILDFSKIEANKLELEAIRFNLRDAIEDVLDLVSPAAAKKKLGLAYFMPEDVPMWIIQDVTRFRQILTNLLSNAIKFTPKGDVSILLSAERIDDSDVLITTVVKDTGIGIPEDRMSRLFQSFSQVDASTTRRYGGTGLGLAISKQLSELLGGSMSVESVDQKGSAFTFSIKAAYAESTVATRPPCFEKKRTALVHGFNETEHAALHHLLHALNFDVVDSEEGHMGSKSKGSDNDIDILIGSIDSTSQADQLNQISEAHPDVPVLQIRRRNHQSDKQSKDNRHTLYKPLKPRQIQDNLGRLFNDKSSTTKLSKEVKKNAFSNGYSPSILVAEDNRINQKIVIRILEKHGFSADIANNGLEVIDAMYRQNYDIILMDINMPELDGLSASRRIRKEFPTDKQPHIIAMTANALMADREACLQAGLDDFVSKPLNIEQFIEALHNAPSITNQPAAPTNKGS